MNDEEAHDDDDGQKFVNELQEIHARKEMLQQKLGDFHHRQGAGAKRVTCSDSEFDDSDWFVLVNY